MNTYPKASDRQVHAAFNAQLELSLARAAVSLENKRARIEKAMLVGYKALLSDLRKLNHNDN